MVKQTRSMVSFSLSKSTYALLMALISSFASCYAFSFGFSTSPSELEIITSSSTGKITNFFGKRHTATDFSSARQSRIDRKTFIAQTVGILGAFAPICSASAPVTGADDGNLPDLPSDAIRSYLQYRIPLQISVDYYLFELKGKLRNVEDWGEVGQLFVSSGGGQPSRMERDFINPMRILELSMPPDEADALQKARNRFEKAMQFIGKGTAGIRRDLPVEVSQKDIEMATRGWEDGRVALNEYLVALNTATGLMGELKTIPAGNDPDQVIAQYGRSQRKFFDLMKRTKQCQNRGGPTIAQTWGGLMVSGYIQDSCGIPDLVDYFFQ